MTKKVAIRTAVGLFSLAALFSVYRWYQNFVIDPDLGSAKTDGWIAAVREEAEGSQVVIIKPDGTIVPSPGYVAGQNEKDPAWSPDGNRLFFSSDRDKGVFQITRWNPGNDKVEVRSVGSRSKAGLNFSPPGYKISPPTGMIVSGGVVLEMNPREATTRQVLPPVAGATLSAEEGGKLGQFDAIYQSYGQSFKMAKFGKDRQSAFGVMRDDVGEVLIYQDFAAKKAADGTERMAPPQLLVAGDRIDFDVNADGVVIFSVRGFRFTPIQIQNLPKEFIKNGEVVVPFRHAMMIFDPAKDQLPRTLFASKDDKQAISDVRFNPAGDQIAFRSGIVEAGNQFSPKALVVGPLSAENGSAAKAIAQGNIGDFSWSIDGSRLLYIDSMQGKRAVFSVRTDGEGMQNLTGDKGNFSSPVMSPQVAK